MAIEASKVEVSRSGAEHSSGSAVRIVVVASNYGAAAGEHFPDRAEVITRVEVRRCSDVLTLPVIALSYGVRRVAEFTFLLTVPDEFARRVDRRAGFLDNLNDTAQPVIGEFAPRCEARIIDGDEPIRSVPLKCSGPAVARDAAVQVVRERAVCSTGLAGD